MKIITRLLKKEYMKHKSVEEIVSEFETLFYEIMGLEVAPDGSDDMFLIRNGDGEVEEGIDFSSEKAHLAERVRIILQQRDNEWKREIEEARREIIILNNKHDKT